MTALALLTGCDMQPEGTLIFEIPSKSPEYDKAQIAWPESLERRPPVKLRWLDTNTFLTTATLSPGRYLFSARSSDGLYYGREVIVTEEKKRYTLPVESEGATTVAAGPPLTGTIVETRDKMPKEIAVLFIGHDLTIRRVAVEESGRFEAEAPAQGTFRVEIHALGDPPRSWVRDKVAVNGPTQLDVVSLR